MSRGKVKEYKTKKWKEEWQEKLFVDYLVNNEGRCKEKLRRRGGEKKKRNTKQKIVDVGE